MRKNVFEKIKLGGIEMNNRIIRSAVAELRADINGYVTDKLIKEYEDLGDENIGLIITGLTEVIKGTQTYTLMKIHDNSYIDGLKKLVDAIHEKDNKIMIQLVHHGAKIIGELDYQAFTPSGFDDEERKLGYKVMTKDDINKVVNDFGDAALRAKKAGFDGVQVHGAHGYLLSKFLSPYYNKREDEYGGNVENRARIILEVYDNIREKCGKDYPVFIKIGASDFMGDEGFVCYLDYKKNKTFKRR